MSDMWEDIEHLKAEDQGAALAADALEVEKESVIEKTWRVRGLRSEMYYAAYALLEAGLSVEEI